MYSFVIAMAGFVLPAGVNQRFVHIKNKNFLVFVGISLNILGHQEEFLLGNSFEQEVLNLRVSRILQRRGQ